MNHMYEILAEVGWMWTAVVALLLAIDWLVRRHRDPRGFDVVEHHDKHP